MREVDEDEGGVVLLVHLDGRVRRPLGGLDGCAWAPEAVEGEGAEASLELLAQARRVGVDVGDLFLEFNISRPRPEIRTLGCKLRYLWQFRVRASKKMLHSDGH